MIRDFQTAFVTAKIQSIKLRHRNRQIMNDCHCVFGFLPLPQERSQMDFFHFRGRQLSDCGRVDMLTIDPCFIMQVRTGGAAGGTDKADDFARLDMAF